MRTRGVYQSGTTATSGAWRRTPAWLAVLVLACGRPDDAQRPSLPADVRAMDAGEPAASEPDESSTGDDFIQARAWGLDQATGECQPYANPDDVPDGGRRFDSDMECRCSIESCPSTIEEAELRLCAAPSPSADVVRFVGCGLVAIVDYSGYQWTFEQPKASDGSGAGAPRLVGAARSSDTSAFDAGSASSWQAGVNPAYCDYDGEASECQLCGSDPAGDFSPCQ